MGGVLLSMRMEDAYLTQTLTACSHDRTHDRKSKLPKLAEGSLAATSRMGDMPFAASATLSCLAIETSQTCQRRACCLAQIIVTITITIIKKNKIQ